MKRPSKEQYYLNIAKEVVDRSTCMSAQHSAILVKDDQIISTGYNGAPRKTQDCFERGNCLRRKLNVPSGHRYELCRSVHAEQNAIINAARAGVSLLGADIYMYSRKVFNGENKKIVSAPCFICKKMIINAGISKFITYDEEDNVKIFYVDDWTEDWSVKDMVDDTSIYDAKYDNK